MKIQCFSLGGEEKCCLILRWIGERVWRSLEKFWRSFWRQEYHFGSENLADWLKITAQVKCCYRGSGFRDWFDTKLENCAGVAFA